MHNDLILPIEITNWLPTYSLRVSNRCKRISLRFSVSKGFEIIIPRKIRKRKVIEFVSQNRSWIEKNQKLLPIFPSTLILPTEVDLAFINQIWQINYIPTTQKKITVKMQYPFIFVQGDVTDIIKTTAKITKHLQNFAQPHLERLLQKLSLRCDLPYNKLTVRKQNSRWGSCSKNKNINLNYKLIFLPETLVEYIVIHELCHTRHFDHSERFWALVANFLPNYQELKQKLKEKERKLPFWINQ